MDDDDSSGHRCRWCGRPLDGYRADAVWCSRAHKMAASRSESAQAAHLGLGTYNPLAFWQGLVERAQRPNTGPAIDHRRRYRAG